MEFCLKEGVPVNEKFRSKAELIVRDVFMGG
jgi:hypothetical protein